MKVYALPGCYECFFMFTRILPLKNMKNIELTVVCISHNSPRLCVLSLKKARCMSD